MKINKLTPSGFCGGVNKALKILKPGNEMIYSTCSILEQENENI